MSRRMPTAQRLTPVLIKRGVRSKVRLLLPRRKSWRLCHDHDGVEMIGVLKKEQREKLRTERLMGYT